MISKKGKCNGCGLDDIYIVNKKYGLCNKCNYIRINGIDAINEKQQKNSLKRSEVNRSNKIKQKSSKQSIIDKEYEKIKEDFISKLKDSDGYYCKGCGNPNNLSLSHLIRRSRDSSLTPVIENMTIHCLIRPDGSEGCHQRWETISKMWELQDFNDNMKMIRKIDPEYYWILMGKLRSMGIDINVNLHKEI